MIKKYNFENSANKALMAEILSKRDRKPRAAFLSSLAAVMIAAISLTMVFGSLPTNAIPLENQEQANESLVTDSDTLPPEEVVRVHTETKTKTVTVNNDTSQLSEDLLLPEAVSTEAPAEGKAIFDQAKQIFQWQYKGETFTFFVKDNTVYRRSEKTGRTIAMFKGDEDVFLFCINDRYLFFSSVTIASDPELTWSCHYCYRADLLTGEILRLFDYLDGFFGYYRDNMPEAFVRFYGTDTVFTHHIVHEDGSYETYYFSLSRLFTDQLSYKEMGIQRGYHTLYLDCPYIIENDYDHLKSLGEYIGSSFEIDYDYIKSLGYDYYYKKALLNTYNPDKKYVEIIFCEKQNKTLWYYAKITDKGLVGGLIEIEFLNESDLSYYYEFKHTNLGVVYDSGKKSFNVPINFDKLTASTTSKPEYYYSDDGTGIAITYLPCKSTNAATPDSAE